MKQYLEATETILKSVPSLRSWALGWPCPSSKLPSSSLQYHLTQMNPPYNYKLRLMLRPQPWTWPSRCAVLCAQNWNNGDPPTVTRIPAPHTLPILKLSPIPNAKEQILFSLLLLALAFALGLLGGSAGTGAAASLRFLGPGVPARAARAACATRSTTTGPGRGGGVGPPKDTIPCILTRFLASFAFALRYTHTHTQCARQKGVSGLSGRGKSICSIKL
jgi:hypothetical protein